MKNKTTAGLFAFFLGGIGIHKFYLNQTTAGVLYLLFSWTCIPAILAFIDAIILLTVSDDEFNAKYNDVQISTKTSVPETNRSQSNAAPKQPTINQTELFSSQPNTESKNAVDSLIHFKKLLDDGVISQDEFDAIKHKVFGVNL